MKKILFPLLILLFSCIPELIPPVVEIIYPSDGSEYEKGETINVRVDASDEDGIIAELRFFVDDFGMASTAEFPYIFLVSTENIPVGSHTMKVVATDDDGKEAETTAGFTIISALAVVETQQPSIITSDSVVLNGSILNDGGTPVSKAGFLWGTEANNMPSYTEVDASLDGISFSYKLTELTAETIYVVAFAENEKGRSYGEVIEFNTIPPENQPPVVTVLSPDNGSELTVGENLEIRLRITDDEDDIAGVRLFIDFMGIASLTGFPYTYTYSTTGMEAGVHSLLVEVTDGQGAISTSTVIFTILPILPEVLTDDPQSITNQSLIAGGTIVDAGGGTISAVGVRWGLEPNDGTGYTDQPASISDDKFSVTLLVPEFGDYYYIAYAENEAGRSYGEPVYFQPLVPDNMFIDERDGNAYKWVQIGSQVWMAENLAYLPEMKNTYNSSATDPYYYVYDYYGFNEEEALSQANYDAYGVLYNYPAAEEACPAGWRLPTLAEEQTLVAYIGGKLRARTLVEVGNEHWSNNTTGTNTTGFTARGAGKAVADQNGVIEFRSQLEETGYWMADTCSNEAGMGLPFSLIQGNPFILRDDQCSPFQNGYSIRCVKE